jgi:hypothetical protein
MPVPMDAAAIEARLREVARLSKWTGARPPRVDMSPAAIEARLREVAELRRTCLLLEGAGQGSVTSRTRS